MRFQRKPGNFPLKDLNYAGNEEVDNEEMTEQTTVSERSRALTQEGRTVRTRACWWRCGSGEGFASTGRPPLRGVGGGQAGSESITEVLRASRRARAPTCGPFSTSATRRLHLSKQDSIVLSLRAKAATGPGPWWHSHACQTALIWDGWGLPLSLWLIFHQVANTGCLTASSNRFSPRGSGWGLEPTSITHHLLLLSTWTSADGRGHPTCCTEGPGLQDAVPVRTEARGVPGRGGLAADARKVVSKSTWRQTFHRRFCSVNSEPRTYRRLRTGEDCFPRYENQGFKY